MAIEILQHNRVTWTNIINVTPQDVETLRERYSHFHPLDLEDLLSTIERPKLDEYDDYLFVVLQFPYWDRIRRISRSAEVDIFVGSGYIITVHDGSLTPMRELFHRCQTDEEMRQQVMGRGASKVFYSVIDHLVDYLFRCFIKLIRKSVN